ncbi:pyridoxal-phosphate dependent enzyme [Tistrella bauzanensis]
MGRRARRLWRQSPRHLAGLLRSSGSRADRPSAEDGCGRDPRIGQGQPCPAGRCAGHGPAPVPTQALSIGTVQGTFQSLVSVRRSGGVAEVVADAALWQAQADLARHEGIFGELSSMASIAAAGQLRQRGVIGPEESVVCIMTASGLKDIDQRPPQPATRHKLAGGLDEVLRLLAAEFGTGFA